MTSLAVVILEPFGPERASRAGSAKGKNLNSCRAMARKSQTDPLPQAGSPGALGYSTHLTTPPGGRRLLVDSRFPWLLPVCFRRKDPWRVARGLPGVVPGIR